MDNDKDAAIWSGRKMDRQRNVQAEVQTERKRQICKQRPRKHMDRWMDKLREKRILDRERKRHTQKLFYQNIKTE